MCIPVPEAGTVIARLAVVPPATEADPTFVPSMVKATVPVGIVVPARVAVRTAVTCMELPPTGVVEAGVTASEVTVLEAVKETVDVVMLV